MDPPDLTSHFNRIDFKGNYSKFLSSVDRFDASLRLDKSFILGEYRKISEEDLSGMLGTGKYELESEGIIFRFFFNSVPSGKMYVFLNSATGNPDMFNRWSWNPFGLTLAFADPMLLRYGLRIGWYYGDRDHDYRELIVGIVRKISSAFNVVPGNIVFYGSSCGGLAAIHMSAMLEGSVSVSFNPQLSTRDLKKEHILLEKKIGISTDDPEVEYRDHTRDAIIKGTSVHLLVVNANAKGDFESISRMAMSLGVTPVYGLASKGNFHMWTYSAYSGENPHWGGWSYHGSVDYLALFSLVDHVIWHISEPGIDPFVWSVNAVWKDRSFFMHQELLLQTMRDAGNDHRAQLRMAYLYEHGEFVEKDVHEAMVWMMRSAGNGNEKAKTRLYEQYLRDYPELKAEIIEYAKSHPKDRKFMPGSLKKKLFGNE